MQSDREKHPLDDDVDNDFSSTPSIVGRDFTQAYRPLFTFSKYVLISSGAVVFLSGVATSNAEPNSAFESVASVINRLSIVMLLCGFVSLLIAYRIPHLRIPLGKTTRRSIDVEILLATNAAAIGLIWCCALVTPVALYSVLLLISSGLFVVLLGLLVTMIVWHDGWLRAYAIGAVVASAPILSTSFSVLGFLMPGGWGNRDALFVAATLWSLPLLAGTTCAIYVKLLLHVRSTRKALLHDSLPDE